MILMDNLQYYLLKRLNQKQTYIFYFKIFNCFIVYLSKKLCPYLIFKLLKRARIETLPWAPFWIDAPLPSGGKVATHLILYHEYLQYNVRENCKHSMWKI